MVAKQLRGRVLVGFKTKNPNWIPKHLYKPCLRYWDQSVSCDARNHSNSRLSFFDLSFLITGYNLDLPKSLFPEVTAEIGRDSTFSESTSTLMACGGRWLSSQQWRVVACKGTAAVNAVSSSHRNTSSASFGHNFQALHFALSWLLSCPSI